MNDSWKVGLVLKMRAIGKERSKKVCERKEEGKRKKRTCNCNPELADQHIDHPVSLPRLEVVIQLVKLLANIVS